MKTFTLITLSLMLLMSCNSSKKSNTVAQNQTLKNTVQKIEIVGKDTLFTFESEKAGELPANWSQYYTARGEMTDWKVVEDNGNKVMAQLSYDQPNRHYNEVVFNKIKTKNVTLQVKMKAVKGKKDQGGGFVWRFIDKDNYYLVRANPLEDNVVLYKVENGKRTDLPVLGKGRTYGVDVEKLGMGWNQLKLQVIDDLFRVYLNEKEIFQVKDATFSQAGKIGLWTKADAVTYFDDFMVKIVKE